MSPLCESYVPAERLGAMEPFYPLHVRVCEHCLLVQLEEFVAPEEIFTEYAYFSSYSDSWVAHARDYVESVVERFGLGADSLVVELASNDGYLLQHRRRARHPGAGRRARGQRRARRRGSGGSRPSSSSSAGSSRPASWRRAAGPTCWSRTTCFAHVPDLNDFVAGMRAVLAPEGVITIEFPHLVRLMEGNQFDTIYHEHFSYFSFLTAQTVLRGPRPRGVRRRGAPHARRLAAGLRTAARKEPASPSSAAGGGAGRARAGARHSTGSRDTARSRRG